MSADPYPCPFGCGEMLFKTENRVNQYGTMIPLNFYDGKISRRGEAHLCPTKVKVPEKPPVYVNEKAADLQRFMWHKAVLGKDGWWYAVDEHGKWTKRLEKARLEELQSWDPSSPDGVDHSRDGTIHT